MSVLATAAPAVEQAVDAYTLTTGRLLSLVGTVSGLAGLVIGGLALARSRRVGARPGKRGAMVALVAGLACLVIGGVVVAAADGGPGTGYGIVGGFVDLVVGLIATVLSGLALARSRRATSPADRIHHERVLG
ncbi:DUF6223 family protein [Amycolatopsis taiwanensis]|uniref:Uncharacterized protein n=1 Tax=Amycolatopsis taiwanensis TaxID=342230 RepID=A0A9W6R7W0_9PSEU|nr:DUF6223 family protein [Amycolatopsis taiwanensis]GLY70999.1 hypothetical protein Atai01_76180 [Amycolatopsis taiwanensis]